MILAHVEVGRSIKTAVEEISNCKGYRDLQSEHKYENTLNCLHFVCKMFSYKSLKSLELLKIKNYRLANKVNTNYKNVIIRDSILFLVYIRKLKGEKENVECNNSEKRKVLSVQI